MTKRHTALTSGLRARFDQHEHVSISRNAPCPCGSGQKYERCCRAREESIVREAAFVDAVGRRIQDWSAKHFDDELGMALGRFVGSERAMDEGDLMLFSTWFHNDRQLAGGGTPAERYAARADLPVTERDVASRIAGARLGLYRVLSAEPGHSLTLESVVGDARVEVASPLVSRDAVRWDILLAHVMEGDRPSLWGPVRFFEPRDEPELRAEMDRLAGISVEQLDEAALVATYRRHAFELMRFVPERLRAERSLFTLEGDPLTFASASWQVRDLPSATARLVELGGLLPDDPAELEITVSRASLVAQRPELPPGAVIVEASPVDAPESAPIATLRLEDGRLLAETMSQPRLEHVIEIVTADFGPLVELIERNVTYPDDTRGLPATGRAASPAVLEPADTDEHQILSDLVSTRMRQWLDEPHPLLDGRSPREARTGRSRAKVVGLIRQLENGAERARRRGEPAADVARLRCELDLSDEFAA
jgi:hypothetical protein